MEMQRQNRVNSLTGQSFPLRRHQVSRRYRVQVRSCLTIKSMVPPSRRNHYGKEMFCRLARGLASVGKAQD
jgi:hypothetical protein